MHGQKTLETGALPHLGEIFARTVWGTGRGPDVPAWEGLNVGGRELTQTGKHRKDLLPNTPDQGLHILSPPFKGSTNPQPVVRLQALNFKP